MTVQELIEKLQAVEDKSMPVLVRAYETNLNEADSFRIVEVADTSSEESLRRLREYGGYIGRFQNIIRTIDPEHDNDLMRKYAETKGYKILKAVYLWSTFDGQYTL